MDVFWPLQSRVPNCGIFWRFISCTCAQLKDQRLWKHCCLPEVSHSRNIYFHSLLSRDTGAHVNSPVTVLVINGQLWLLPPLDLRILGSKWLIPYPDLGNTRAQWFWERCCRMFLWARSLISALEEKRKENNHFVSGETAKLILLKTRGLPRRGWKPERGWVECCVPFCAGGEALEVARHEVWSWGVVYQLSYLGFRTPFTSIPTVVKWKKWCQTGIEKFICGCFRSCPWQTALDSFVPKNKVQEGRNTNSVEKSLVDHLNPVLGVNMSSVLYGHHMYDDDVTGDTPPWQCCSLKPSTLEPWGLLQWTQIHSALKSAGWCFP